MLREKGYDDDWFVLGFFFSVITFVIAYRRPEYINITHSATLPPAQYVSAKSSEAAYAEKLKKAGGWKCSCGRMNPSYTSTCACGKNKRDILHPAHMETQPEPASVAPVTTPAAPEHVPVMPEPVAKTSLVPSAYEGNQPYIFVSYAHLDTKKVFKILNALQENGFRLWFDGGIEAGTEWPEYIANHLGNSACVLSFISENFVRSANCRRELNYAQNLEKPMLNIYLDEAKLSAGMQMQLGLDQAIMRKNFDTDEDFFTALSVTKMLKSCR